MVFTERCPEDWADYRRVRKSSVKKDYRDDHPFDWDKFYSEFEAEYGNMWDFPSIDEYDATRSRVLDEKISAHNKQIAIEYGVKEYVDRQVEFWNGASEEYIALIGEFAVIIPDPENYVSGDGTYWRPDSEKLDNVIDAQYNKWVAKARRAKEKAESNFNEEKWAYTPYEHPDCVEGLMNVGYYHFNEDTWRIRDSYIDVYIKYDVPTGKPIGNVYNCGNKLGYDLYFPTLKQALKALEKFFNDNY